MRTGTAVLVGIVRCYHERTIAHRIAHRHLCATSCAMAKLIALIIVIHSVKLWLLKQAINV